MPPPSSLASSLATTSIPTAASNLLSSSASASSSSALSSRTALRRLLATSSVLSASSATHNNIIMPASATPTSAFATAANTGSNSATASSSPQRKVFFPKITSWRPSPPSFSFYSKQRTFSTSISSVPPSITSSSSSQSDDHPSFVDASSVSAVRQFSSTTPTPSSASGGKGSSKLSSIRASAAIKLLPSYLIDARAITQYSPSTPDGALQLSVAENQLSELPIRGLKGIQENTTTAGGVYSKGDDDMKLVHVLSQLASSTIARSSDEGARDMNVFEREMIYYQPTQGSPGLRLAMAEYLQGLLLSPTSSSSNTNLAFNPENIVVGAGCNAVLENLCMVLANPGDAVLIPTPYYAAFEFDLVARAGCNIIPVNTLNHQTEQVPTCGKPIPPHYYYPNKLSLQLAYDRTLEETGRPPRVLLLSHPNNPLGICYPPSVVQECIDWCREMEVHLISDEIYAGSVYRKERVDGSGSTFVSAMALGATNNSSSDGGGEEGLGLGPYVHLVYALSKDFALSGLRVGVAYTENEEILLPLQKLNDLCQISSQTQLLVERMVTANAVTVDDDKSEKKFVDVYLKESQGNIRNRCDALQSYLDELNIPYLPADSGLFVWMDFREFLPSLEDGVTEAMETLESKEQRERKLYLSLMKEYGLLFTPGMSMRNERAGFFRCVFTAASEEEFDLGLARLKKFVEEMRS